MSFIRFILPRCCWSFVLLCSLVLFLSFLSFPVSSGLLYFSWEFFSLYLFILEGSDSLVSISGFRPLPGWGPPQDNNVYSSRPWTARMAAVKNPPPPPPPLRLAVIIGKLVAWESWVRFVRVGISLAMRARTTHSSADHREVRTALSLLVPLGQALVFFKFLWRVTCGRGLQSLKQVTSSLSFFVVCFVLL